MYVVRRERPLPKRTVRPNKPSHAVGAIITIMPSSHEVTAAFSADDLCDGPEVEFCAEDYYMQLDIPRL